MLRRARDAAELWDNDVMAGLLDRSTSRRAFGLGDAGPVGATRAAEAGRLRQGIDLDKAVERMRANIVPHSIASDRLNMDHSWKRSVLLGIASIFDFTGKLAPKYRKLLGQAKEDTSALNGDWLAIANDFRRIMDAAGTLDLNRQVADQQPNDKADHYER